MKKSTTIIIIIIVVFTVVALISKFILTDKQETSPTPSNQFVSQNVPPALPDSERDQYVKVDNPKNSETAKKIFEAFANESAPESAICAGVKNIKVTDGNERRLDLTKIISSLNINIPETLLGLIDTNNFEIFYCPATSEKKDFGLVFYAKAREGKPLVADDYQRITELMRKWENTMLQDLHFSLFPDAHFSDEELGQMLSFQNGEARFANVQFSNGAKKSINYKQFGAPIVITSSLQCLNNAEGYFFDTEE